MASSNQELKEDLIKRLRRIEGQVRGVQRMIEEDQYCVDVLVQIAAVRAALYKVGFNILENHAHGCVMQAVRAGGEQGDEVLEELLDVVFKFAKP